jgi:hypothetical protein
MNTKNETRWSKRARASHGRHVALALTSLLSLAACADHDEPAGHSSDLAAAQGHDALGNIEMVDHWNHEASASFESILAEAGDNLIVNDDPALSSVSTGNVEHGTYYLRDGNIVAKVEVTPVDVRVRTFVRGGGRAPHGVNVSTQCELVPHFYTSKELDLGDEVIARCTEDYPVLHASIGIIDMSEASPVEEPPSEGAADTFEAILAEAGDEVREHNIPGQAGSHTDNMQRGTVYLLDGDVIAKVVVTATEVTVRTYVRGGGRAPHDVAVSTTCELVRPWTLGETLESGGEVISRCTADYPVVNTVVSLATHTE